jgi:hypothetical protein
LACRARTRSRSRIEAPQGLRVVMSADNDPKATGKSGWRFTIWPNNHKEDQECTP